MVTFHASAVTSFLSSFVTVSTFMTDSFSSRVISLGKLNIVLILFFSPTAFITLVLSLVKNSEMSHVV